MPAVRTGRMPVFHKGETRMRFLVLMVAEVYQAKKGRKTGPDFLPGGRDAGEDGTIQRGARFGRSRGSAGYSLFVNGQKGDGSGMQKPSRSRRVLELMKRCPAQEDDVIEIRQVAELSDFPAEVQAAAKRDC